ncbi:MAG: peptidoglycan DD-metalloendopeptidase family protein [Erysipelotrichaceae bacterium]
MRKSQQILLSILVLTLSLGLAFMGTKPQSSYTLQGESEEVTQLIEQARLSLSTTQNEVFEVYLKDTMLGVVQDKAKLDALLQRVYEERYEEIFPDTNLWFGEDVIVKSVLSYQVYEDKDDEILAYLDENDMFSVEVDKVEFSNGEVAYVKNIDEFREARDLYVLNYIDKASWELFTSNKKTPELTKYGTRDVSFAILESATVTKGLASASRILKTKEEALSYLSYGYDAVPTYYEVQEFDTVEGIAWLNSLTVEHLISINADKIRSENQVLEVGMELDVSEPDSPITVQVEREKLVSEKVYPPATQYVYDATVTEGVRNVIQTEKMGKKNVKYKETYINGELVSGEVISSLVIEAAQPEIISIGTKVIPNVGSGSFRWPVDNPRVTCGWGCYYNHQAIDIQNAYNRYGNIYASDRGVVTVNSYHPINGYWVEINHNNGYTTYYGHMNRPGFPPVGTTVAKGELIGQIGMTGLATGPHVHFEIRRNGVKLNPITFMGN